MNKLKYKNSNIDFIFIDFDGVLTNNLVYLDSKGIELVAKKVGISIQNGEGYRALTNIGNNGGQEVQHLHFHLFGGEKVGKMVS